MQKKYNFYFAKNLAFQFVDFTFVSLNIQILGFYAFQ